MFNRKKPLTGGLLNDGRITKVGATVVRRQDHAWPRAVSEALTVLRSRGFRGCPHELCRVDRCTVVLSFIPGRSLRELAPRWASTTRTLTRVTGFMKAFSLAGTNMRAALTNSDWLTEPVHDEDVFFHGDPHPTNIVFDSFRRPKAIIDFELATLGSHDLNLLSLIFNWAPLEPQHMSWWWNIHALSVRERVRTMLDCWQPTSDSRELVELGMDFISWRQEWIENLGRLGNPGAQQLITDPSFPHRLAHARILLKQLL